MNRPLVACALLGLTFVIALRAQEKEQFAGSTTVLAVEIPVHVYRGDEPIRGLTADQFRVLDGGVERAIVDFEVIDLALADDAEAGPSPGVSSSEDTMSVPLAAQRHFLLLFDLSFIERENLLRAVRSARQLLDGPLHATDRVGLGVFGASRGARLLVGFTPNHAQIGHALDALEALVGGEPNPSAPATVSARDARVDPLRLFLAGRASVAADIGRNTGSEWSDGVATDGGGGLSSGTISDMIDVTRVEIAQRRQGAILDFTDALAQLAAGTAEIEGRKNLVLFSQGFNLPTGDIYLGDNIRVLKAMDRVVDVFRRAGWMLQGVNVSGLDDSRYGSEVLFKMASETGGELYERFNDVGAAVGRMLNKSSVTYLLTIQVEEVPLDGAFRRLDVRLRDKPRGVRVQHREGYHAPGATPPPESGLSRTLALGQRVLTGDEGGSIPTDVLALSGDAVGDRRQVSVWVAADGPSFLADQGDDAVGGDVFVYALDALGEIQDFFTQTIALERDRAREPLEQGTLQVYGTVALAPGRHTLRVLVRSAAGHESLRQHTIDVPAITAGSTVSPPLFLADAAHPLVVVRVADPDVDTGTAAARYPFRMAGRTFVPEVRPVLASGAPRRVVVLANQLDETRHAVRARVTRDGEEVEGALLEIVGRGELDAHGGHPLFLQLDAAALEPGAYALEIAVDDTEDDATVAVGVQPFWVATS